MSPNDLKATKFCAQLMEVSERGYNPMLNDHQADALAERFGLTAHEIPGFNEGYDILKNGKVVKGFIGYSRNKAIVEAVCYLADAKWYDKPMDWRLCT